jgi:hypothetical protein
MSSKTPSTTNGIGSKDPSNASTEATKTKTAADLVAALIKARADKAAADKAAADKAAADKAADSFTAAWIRSAAHGNARAAARVANESKDAAKLVLHQQRIADAAAARAAAAAAAKATREAAYNADHKKWNEKFQEAQEELDACTKGTGIYAKYHEAIPFARLWTEFEKLCSECESSDKSVADAAKNLKQLVDEYRDALAEKAKAVEKLKEQEPEHPNVVFGREFVMFFQNRSNLTTVISSLLEGPAVCSRKLVAAGFDPNFFCMFGALFVLSSHDDTVSLDLSQLHPYDRSKDKSNLGRDAFHLWCLQHAIFGFIQNRLVPLVDPSSDLTLEVLMLNFKHLLPKHIHDRDAQIAEHLANIQATMEYHLQMKEKNRRRNREATPKEFAEHERACEEHLQKEAAAAAKSRELTDRVKVFIQDSEKEILMSNLQSLGIQDSAATWNNPTAPTHALAQFLAANDLATFCDAIRFLQEAGIIAYERSIIPTPKNPTREAFAFIFGKETQSSSDSKDEHVGPAAELVAELVAEKTQQPSNKTFRIIRGDDDLTIAKAIREANLEKQRLASHASSNAEESSAKEPTGADLPPSVPAPVFETRQQFLLSQTDAATIAAENGLKAETVSLVVMMKGVQSISAASGPDVIKAAKHIEAQIAAEEKAAEEKAAKEAAEKFKQEKRADILARLAQRRSGSVGGGASASAAVVPSSEGDSPLTAKQRLAIAKAKRDAQIVAQAAAAASSPLPVILDEIFQRSNPALESAKSFLPSKK